jgi:hypothetical protein
MNPDIKIYWINNFNPRAYYLQFSLMKLAKQNEISYKEILKKTAIKKFNLSDNFFKGIIGGISCFIAQKGNSIIKVLVDDSDGFGSLSPSIVDADLYFCGPYNSSFHASKEFKQPYKWLKDYNLNTYIEKANYLIKQYGEHFGKIKKYIPVAMGFPNVRKIHFRFTFFKIPFLMPILLGRKKKYKLFQKRYNELLKHRDNRLNYDIVVRDTLWGWPPHRAKLHQQLNRLSSKYKIYNQVNPYKNSKKRLQQIKSQYPDIPIENINRPIEFVEPFEKMSTSSRLCVFATGKHWGWRMIMFVVLINGLPILMDKPLYEPYFDLNNFKIFYTENEWEDIEKYLELIDDNMWN